MAPSLGIMSGLCALEFHSARLLPASATSLFLSRSGPGLLAAVQAALLTDLRSACHYPQEPQVTRTMARPSRPARGTAWSELHKAQNGPIRLYPAEALMDALTVQPRDGRGRELVRASGGLPELSRASHI